MDYQKGTDIKNLEIEQDLESMPNKNDIKANEIVDFIEKNVTIDNAKQMYDDLLKLFDVSSYMGEHKENGGLLCEVSEELLKPSRYLLEKLNDYEGFYDPTSPTDRIKIYEMNSGLAEHYDYPDLYDNESYDDIMERSMTDDFDHGVLNDLLKKEMKKLDLEVEIKEETDRDGVPVRVNRLDKTTPEYKEYEIKLYFGTIKKISNDLSNASYNTSSLNACKDLIDAYTKNNAAKENSGKVLKEYYTKDEWETAKNRNIVDYLKSIGYELKLEGNFYKGVLHDSLAINRNGEWHWNSKDLHGREPINLLSQILQTDYGYDEKDAYINAVKRLAGTEGERLPVENNKKRMLQAATDTIENKPFVLPSQNKDMKKTIAYLCTARKLDYSIVAELITQHKIYETKDTHNACFVSHDKDGVPRHGFLRGTLTNAEKAFKQDVPGSDKNYAFTLMGNENSNKVYCFESDIDLISHATLYKMHGLDYKDGHRISLGGTSFLGLEQFLKDNPNITEIVSCLDNDQTGNRRSDKMCSEYSEKGFHTFRQAPKEKDFNEQLVTELTEPVEMNNENINDMGAEIGDD